MHVFIDNCPPDAAVSAHVHAVEQDGAFHECVAVDPDVGRQDAAADMATADDGAMANHAVVGLAPTSLAANAVVGKDKFRRRHLWLMRTDGPFLVIQVENW